MAIESNQVDESQVRVLPVPRQRVYLDHLSSCPVLPEVREAMLPFLDEHFGHPASLHQEALIAREAIKRSRIKISALVNSESPDSILFTGSPAEAMNLAVKGAALAQQRIGKHLVLTNAEQPALAQSVEWLETQGFSATRVAVDSLGRIGPAAIQAAIRPDTTLVCLHHANLDIGTLQPVKEIGALTSDRGVTLLLDCTASAGWTAVDVQSMRADLAVFAPHRFYGPKGIGVLYRHRRARLTPLLHGLDLETAENVAGVAGTGRAAEIAVRELITRENHTRSLQRLLLQELTARIPHLRVNGPEPGPNRLPNSLNVSIEFVEGEGLALMLDVRGVALASGAACVTKTMRIPPVLGAIGLPESLAKGNVILSFGQETTETDILFAVETMAKAVPALREMSPLWDDFMHGRIKSELEN